MFYDSNFQVHIADMVLTFNNGKYYNNVWKSDILLLCADSTVYIIYYYIFIYNIYILYLYISTTVKTIIILLIAVTMIHRSTFQESA